MINKQHKPNMRYRAIVRDKLVRQKLYTDRVSIKQEIMSDEPYKVDIGYKASRRFSKYVKKHFNHQKTINAFRGFVFAYKGKSVRLLGFEFNNLGTYWYIPFAFLSGVYCCDTKRYDLIQNLKKGQTILPNEEMCSMFPGLFKINKPYKITNDILTIYYSFNTEADLVSLTKYIIFQQCKMIYRKKNEKQRYKNY